MKNNAKLAIAFTLAAGLMSSTAMAASGWPRDEAGAALVGFLVQAGAEDLGRSIDKGWIMPGGLDWESRGNLLYTERFEDVARLHFPRAIQALAELEPAAGGPDAFAAARGPSFADAIVLPDKRYEPAAMVASASFANGARLDAGTGSTFSEKVFYDRTQSATIDTYAGWVCCEDLAEVASAIFNRLAKEQGFNMKEFNSEQERTFKELGMSKAQAFYVALDVRNQGPMANVLTGRILLEEYGAGLLELLGNTKLDKDFVLPEAVRVTKNLADSYTAYNKGLAAQNAAQVIARNVAFDREEGDGEPLFAAAADLSCILCS